MKKLLFLIALSFSLTTILKAQTTVTFNVNLTPMLKDSTFIPGRDVIQLTGNLFPLGKNRTEPMFDGKGNDADSIYTAVVRFSSRYDNQELEYNFRIVTPEKTKEEKLPRKVSLRGKEVEIPPLFFNAFAW